MMILYPSNAGTYTKAAAALLQDDLNAAFGTDIQLVALGENADISAYTHAIVIGRVGSEACAISDALTEGSYRMKIEASADYRAYLVGKNDYDTLRAVQEFYSRAVKYGKVAFPPCMDITAGLLYNTRDPAVLKYGDKYYLYQAYGGSYAVRESSDLLNWTSPKVIFTKPTGFDGVDNFWAPECHYYDGAFYLFATYRSGSTGYRGTTILRCDTPNGQFKQWSNGFITPKDRDSIDGTLYVDAGGTPWMVYVDEWTNYNRDANGVADANGTNPGAMRYVQLSDDLKSTVGSYSDAMFWANDPSWTDVKVTDGPYLYRCKGGTLLMIWSNGSASGYSVGIARSDNGELDGNWEQLDERLFTGDNANIYRIAPGGHGMIFEGPGGRLYLSVHTPNSGTGQAPLFIPIVERNEMLYLDTVNL